MRRLDRALHVLLYALIFATQFQARIIKWVRSDKLDDKFIHNSDPWEKVSERKPYGSIEVPNGARNYSVEVLWRKIAIS